MKTQSTPSMEQEALVLRRANANNLHMRVVYIFDGTEGTQVKRKRPVCLKKRTLTLLADE